jgi:subfamily B ATP-binding cassette protein MsbA
VLLSASKHKFRLSEEWITYKRLLTYVLPYRGRLCLGVFFGLVFGGSTGGLLAAFQKNIAVMFRVTELPVWSVILIAAALPAFAVLRGIGDFMSRYYVEWVGNRVVMNIRDQTFGHIQDLSILYFTKTGTGDLISRVTNDTMLVQRAVSTVIGDIAREPFVLMFAIGYLLWLDPLLSVMSLVLFPICIIPVQLFGRRVRRASREGQEWLAVLVTILEETITGARIVKAFGMEKYEKDRFATRNHSVFSRLMRVAKARASIEPIIVAISFIGLSLVFLYARLSGMSESDFFTYAAALVVMYQPAKKLSRIHLNIQQSSAAADRIFEILDAPVEVAESTAPTVFDETVKTVTFEKVNFAYEKEPVLQDISFEVGAGECIAIVGSSGGGKTTLVSLLPRFFDVTGGRILLNETDIRDLTLHSLRDQIGMVTQETVLFNDTVAGNISYGHMEASPASIREAARKAYAHEFIMQFPRGYETVIGERGIKLSGGQRQRLAIARAMLRNPPILILDEATSSLDTESERQVQAALDQLMSHRTVFAIAHRLSTIIHAQRILVLDQGRIVEQGTHAALLEKGGLYKRLYDMQFQDQHEHEQKEASS